MLWVILRTGKVLQYNTANNLTVKRDRYEIVKKDGYKDFWVACFPTEVVERVEWVRPYLAMTECPPKKPEKH